MTVLLQVNYTPSAEQDQQSDIERLEAADSIAKNVAGLQWKVWISNQADRIRGGIYLFDHLESARAWGEGNLRARLAAAGGRNISITYFDVDERLSAITRAVLSRPGLAA
ncbi:MAG: YdhR family protein [Xanthobacteraceae bacterium]|nr:YdhR family protein [Xanthobacteraceae bacterium]